MTKPLLAIETAHEAATFEIKRYTRVVGNTTKPTTRTVGIYFELREQLPANGSTDILRMSPSETELLRFVRGRTDTRTNLKSGAPQVHIAVNGGWGKLQVHVEWTFAAKSKDLPTEETAWSFIDRAVEREQGQTVEALIESEIRRILRSECERVMAEQREETARFFATKIARHVDKKAREQIKFAERYEALQAELQAIRPAVLAEVLAEIPANGTDGNADPRIVARAKELAPEQVLTWRDGGFLLYGQYHRDN